MKHFYCLLTLSFIISHSLSAQWVQTNGPGVLNVQCYAIHGTFLFAGTKDWGIFRSTDDGTSWMAAYTGLTNVRSLASSGTHLFAGTDGGGIFLSTNDGTTWSVVNTGLTNTKVQSICLGGTNLYAGTYDHGVFRSGDGGDHWKRVSKGLPAQIHECLAVNEKNLIVVAGGEIGHLFRSGNSGKTWAEIGSGLPDRASVIDLVASGPGLFVATMGGSAAIIVPDSDEIKRVHMGGGVYRSSDEGDSWSAVTLGLPPDALVTSLAASGTRLFAGTWGRGVFTSTDIGASWAPVSAELTSALVQDVIASEEYLFAGIGGRGVWRLPLSMPYEPER